MKHKTLRTLLCVILTVCFCLSAIAPVSAAGLFSGDSGAASIFDEWIRSLKDRFTEIQPGETQVETNEGTTGNKFIRIFHLDCGRKYFTVDQIKRIIDELAANNYTHIELAIGNDGLRFLLDDMSVTVNGTTYSSDAVTEGIQQGNKNYYDAGSKNELTQSEMTEIISYAKAHKISVIPLLNSPGHMDAMIDCMESLGFSGVSYYSSARTIDLTNANATGFTKALIQKYVTYFADNGCKYFNIGADEYANDVSNGGFAALISSSKYGNFVNYVNDIAKIISDANMTPMAFNDGIYYNSTENSGTFDSKIVIAYWTAGWPGYSPASASFLSKKGHTIINTNDAWYYVLGRKAGNSSGYTIATATAGTTSKSVTTVPGTTINNPSGCMLAFWCDTPSASYNDSEFNNIKTLIENLSKNNPDYFTKVEDPTPTIINAPESLMIDDNATLSMSDGTAVWTIDDTSVLSFVDYDGTTAVASVTVRGVSKGNAVVTATVDGNAVDSKTIAVNDPTDPTTIVNISLAIDEEKTEKQENVNVADAIGTYDTNVVTVSAKYESVTGGTTYTLGSKCSLENSNTFIGVITDGKGNFLKMNADDSITNTNTVEDATIFTVSISGSYYTIQEKGTNRYLGYEKTGSYLNYAYSLKNAKSNWRYSTTHGFYLSSGSGYYTAYYSVAFNDGGWKVAKSNYNYNNSNDAALYEVTEKTTDPVNQTTITFKGKAAGNTEVRIGDVLYKITVSEKAPDGALTSQTLTLEYWITNYEVYDGTTTSTNHTQSISSADATSEDGIEIKTLAPEPAYSFFDNTVTVYYWQTMRLDAENQQTNASGDDETADGTTLTHVRYRSGAWQYKTVDGTWHYFASTDQLVAYYLQKTEVTKEIDTYVKDWGYGTSDTTPDTSSSKGQVALTVAVVYPDGTVSPVEGDMYANSTTIFNYWADRDIGIVAPTNNSDYTISKITVTDGARVSNTSANVWYTTDSIEWEKKTLDDGTKWYDETEVWNKSSGTTPMVNGKSNDITWSAKNKGKLVLIYLEVVQKDTNLNVVYWDNHANTQINPNPIQVAVENGVTYLDPEKGLKNVNPLNKGRIELPDNAYITNSSGVNQTFSKDLGNMVGVPSGYTSGLYAYQYAEISEDGKTLTLFYDISTTTYVKNYVVDYGMKITISGLATWLDVNNDVVKLSVAKGSISQDRQGLYGRAIINQTNDTLTYEINKPLMATAVIPIYVYTTKDALSSEAVLKGTINIIPATNVYYEESFFTTGKDNAEGGSSWTTGGNATNSEQTLENAGTNIYVHGFDPIYNSETTFSKGGYMTATLQKPNVSYGVLTNDYLSFTFKGTGYDVVSECGPNTGMLWVERWKDGKCQKITIVDTSFYGDKTFVTGDGILSYQIPVVREMNITTTPEEYEIRIYGYALASAGAFTGGQSETSRTRDASLYTLTPITDSLAIEDNGSFEDILIAHGINVNDVEIVYSYMQDNNEAENYAVPMKSAKMEANSVAQDASNAATTATVYVDAFRVYQPITDESKYDAVETGMKYDSLYKYVKNGQIVDDDITDSAVYVEYDGDQTIERITSIDDYKRGGPQNEVYLTSSANVKNYVGMILYNWSDSSHVMVSAKAIAGNPVLATQTGVPLLSTSIKTSTEMYYDVTEYVEYDEDLAQYILILGNGSQANSVLSVSALKVSSGVTAAASQSLAKRMAFYVVENQVETAFEPRKFQVSESTNAFAGDVITVAVQATDDVDEFVVYSDASLTNVVSYVADPYWSNKRAYNKGKTDVKNYLAYFAAPTEPGEYTYYMAAFDTNGKRSAPVKVLVTVTE